MQGPVLLRVADEVGPRRQSSSAAEWMRLDPGQVRRHSGILLTKSVKPWLVIGPNPLKNVRTSNLGCADPTP